MVSTNLFSWATRAVAAAIVMFFCAHIAGWISLPVISRLEHIAYDERLNLTKENTPDYRIVIVDIDDYSLAKIGRWPWDRRILGNLVETLFKHYQVNTLGFDILFAEAEDPADLKILNSLAHNELKDDHRFQMVVNKLTPTLQRDEMFASAFASGPVILGYYFYRNGEGTAFSSGKLPPPLNVVPEVHAADFPLAMAQGYGANLPLLQNKSAGAGFIDMALVDGDGIMRRLPIIQRYQNEIYEALPLAILRAALGANSIKFGMAGEKADKSVAQHGLEFLELEGLSIPVDERGAILIPFRGPYPSFPYVPASEILNKAAPADILKNAIVLIGTTAPGLLDMRATPIGAVYPGVEIHANIISGILDQRIKHSPTWIVGVQFVIALICGLILTLLIGNTSYSTTWIIYGSLLIALVALYFWSWIRWGIDIPIVPLAIMTTILFALQNSHGFLSERLHKNQLEKLFGQYVPPLVVNEMSRTPDIFSVSGEVRTLTVLFCDLRGFTSFSEHLDPHVLTTLINRYMTLMTTIIYKHRGTIDKYIGDAVMAFWGAPLFDSEHARHALEAAQDMLAELPSLETAFTQQGLPSPKVGIGINTGSMHVGNMGSEFRVAYTVLGDAVNLASRLENLTKRYGVSLLVGETTRNAIPEQSYRELDIVKVAGKANALRIYEPLGKTDSLSPQTLNELERYHTALELYRARQWKEALALFENLTENDAAPLIYQMYLGRCIQLVAHPPGENWNASVSYKDK